MHPEKTKIVSCKDSDRKGHYARESFDFLGYSFRPRGSKSRWGKPFINFSPGVSPRATKAIRQTIKDWRLRCRGDAHVRFRERLGVRFPWATRLNKSLLKTGSAKLPAAAGTASGRKPPA